MSSPMSKTAVQQAHMHASLAEEQVERGQFQLAMESHFHAAENYLRAIAQTQDAEVIRTLKLLYTNHTRQAKDLERRYTLSRNAISGLSGSSGVAATTEIGIEGRPRSLSLPVHKHQVPQASRMDISNTLAEEPRSVSARSSSANSVSTTRSSSSDDEDPFEQFWENVETLVQKMAGPVAFTMAPLHPAEISSAAPVTLPSATPSLEPEDKASLVKHPRTSSRRGITDSTVMVSPPFPTIMNAIPSHLRADPTSSPSSSFTASTAFTVDGSYWMVGGSGAGRSLPMKRGPSDGVLSPSTPAPPSSQSPSQQPPSPLSANKTLEEYAIENRQLKQTIDILSRKLEEAKMLARENTLLKSSIVQFRQDFHRQARKYQMSAHPMQTLRTRQEPPAQEPQRALHQELSRLRAENEQLKRRQFQGGIP